CNATVITATPFTDVVDNALATDDPPLNCSAGVLVKLGVWYAYTPTVDCMAQISETSSQDVVIAVFSSGGDCSGAFEFGCSSADHFGFPMAANEHYWILIGSASSNPPVPIVPLNIRFDCVPLTPPANDDPCGATVITALPFTDNPINAIAGHDQDTTCNLAG